MTLSKTMATADFYREHDLAARDNAIARQEQIDEYVADRVKQIHDQRMANVSLADFKLAVQMMLDLDATMSILRSQIYAGDRLVAHSLQGSISAMLLMDSHDIATAEAKALFSDLDGERH